MVAVTGSVNVRFADTVLLDQATSGDPCELSFGWAIDADKSLLFTVHSAFLPKPNVLIDDQPPAEWRDLTVLHPLALPDER